MVGHRLEIRVIIEEDEEGRYSYHVSPLTLPGPTLNLHKVSFEHLPIFSSSLGNDVLALLRVMASSDYDAGAYPKPTSLPGSKIELAQAVYGSLYEAGWNDGYESVNSRNHSAFLASLAKQTILDFKGFPASEPEPSQKPKE